MERMERRTTGFIFLIVMLVSLALVGCFGGGTKSYILTGTVTESDTEVPLAGAEVKIGGKETITNAYGLYELKGVPGGSGTLRVTLDGYEPNEQDVTVSADAEIDVDLETQAGLLSDDFIWWYDEYDEYVSLDKAAAALTSYFGAYSPGPVTKASLILNGEEQPLYVEGNEFFYTRKALRPGKNTIQIRVWDGDHARTTPILTTMWDIPRLDLLIIMDSDTPKIDLDLHMTKRLVSEGNSFNTLEHDDRHVYWGNETPTDFGDGDHQNPVYFLDAGSFEEEEMVYLEELTPGDYHIWVYPYSLNYNDSTEARVQVILDAATDNPTEEVYTEEIPLAMEETGVYIITLRVDESGERSFVEVEPVLLK